MFHLSKIFVLGAACATGVMLSYSNFLPPHAASGTVGLVNLNSNSRANLEDGLGNMARVNTAKLKFDKQQISIYPGDDINLVGTYRKLGMAIFEISGDQQIVVGLDQEVIRGVILRKVQAVQVALELKGVAFYLPLSEGKAQSKHEEKSDVEIAATDIKSIRYANQDLALVDATRRKEIGLHTLIALAGRGALIPEHSSDGMSGLRFHALDDPDLRILTEIGLQEGDLVQALNGKAVETYDDIAALGMELRESEWIEFTVERGGRQEKFSATLSYNDESRQK